MRFLNYFVTARVFACGASSNFAQDKPAGYPLRPIRIIVGVPPGGGNDTVTRAAAQMLNDRWGQTVVVDNRSGGGTVIGTELGAQAAPDGYTILSATDTLMLLGALKRVVTAGMNSPQMVQKLVAEGSEPGERLTPDEFKARFAWEYAEAEKQVRRLNIKPY